MVHASMHVCIDDAYMHAWINPEERNTAFSVEIDDRRSKTFFEIRCVFSFPKFRWPLSTFSRVAMIVQKVLGYQEKYCLGK